MSSVTYRRDIHAAHYTGHAVAGHDLEIWTVVSDKPTRPSEIPADAELAYGDRSNGKQTWTYTRIADFTPGLCPRCPHQPLYESLP